MSKRRTDVGWAAQKGRVLGATSSRFPSWETVESTNGKPRLAKQPLLTPIRVRLGLGRARSWPSRIPSILPHAVLLMPAKARLDRHVVVVRPYVEYRYVQYYVWPVVAMHPMHP